MNRAPRIAVFVTTLMTALALFTAGATAQMPAPHDHNHAHSHDHDHDHTHDWQALLAPSSLPPADYAVQAILLPDSGVARFALEMLYRHIGTDTVQSLHWRLPHHTTLASPGRPASPHEPGLTLDSISHQAVPLSISQITFIGDHHLRIELFAPVAPGEMTSVYLSGQFRVPLDPDACCWLLADWLPQLLDPSHLSYYADSLDDPRFIAHAPVIVSRVKSAITLDTTFHLAYPGRLLNEKEHFGFLPQPRQMADTLLLDITDGRYLDFGAYRYDPIFADGHKTYYLQDNSSLGFPLAIAPGWRTDRIVHDSVVIDMYYSATSPASTCDALSNTVYAAARWLYDAVGEPHAQRLAISFPNAGHSESPNSHPAFCHLTGNSAADRVAVVRSLVHLWLPPIHVVDNQTYLEFDQGLISHFACRIAQARTGSISNSDLRQWERTYLHGRTAEERAMLRHPLRLYPARLHEMQNAMGERTFDSILTIWLHSDRFAAADPAELFRLLAPDSSEEARWTDWRPSHLAISRATVRPTESGHYQVTLRLDTDHRPLRFPLDILITWATGDTLFTIPPSAGINPDITLTVHSLRRPHAILLDPERKLNDPDRSDNYYRLTYTRTRIPQPQTELSHAFTPLPD
jgi:hypothetical protein